ncbi:GPP34 family phosphoprotein [Pseudoroseomonas cervicalis]|uniref:GOLPH3/VPS74 family protein n=1 Tax=Teichococcus cervicalis TaxID=204525 RepID=UPI002789B0D7|nr:GPP34 family phosphoprotein [Pseudoroseomonas cervicalis]MDQ1081729.1 Golgi phosphoprotein 3 [Pseudoroseomonas cervicalis]
MPLTMPEEILLLTLDDATGRPIGLPGPAAELALAGAMLMELSLAGRIDTDPDRLYRVAAAPLGDAVLDALLARIGATTPERPSRWWIEQLMREAPKLRPAWLERLVQRGVLRREKGRVLWVLPDHRYPKEDGGTTEAVRERLRHVLLQDVIPDARDAMLVGLCRIAGLVPLLLSEAEAARAAGRVEQIAALEEMARALSAATRDLYAARGLH